MKAIKDIEKLLNLKANEITFKFQGKPLKRKGYEFKNGNKVILTLEPVSYKEYKWFASGNLLEFPIHLKSLTEVIKSIKNQSDMGLGRTTPKKKATTVKRKPATKKQGTGSTKKTIRKHEGINQRTGKLKKGYKYGANGRIVKVQTPAQKVRQTGSTHRTEDLQRQAKRPGKRVSANGKTYYERRANRSDKGKLLAAIDGGTYGDLCYKKNRDGSTTIYTSQGGSRPCPYGGRVAVKTVSTLEPLPGTLRGVARKKKPTAKQLAAREKFAANVRAGKYRK